MNDQPPTVPDPYAALAPLLDDVATAVDALRAEIDRIKEDRHDRPRP